MPCALCLPAAISAGLVGLGAAADAAPPAAAPASFVYCLSAGGARVLVGQKEAGGNLRFGLSVWSAALRNISVFGTAVPQGGAWIYSRARCRIELRPLAGGAMRVAADPKADCTQGAGVGASIGRFTFPPGALQGPVHHELDSPEAFQHAGACVAPAPS